ncbi:hypothetical protein CA13_05850 [Planctomycetes bacterium CA13]|uniref:Uncharacterized protein n=1 Tax=Novipirellula herctigrandis TaxID=2527986 RepID=A0A5C5YXA3_9BACT|nr:hypothetical protein CA13_05850 [Planctomycetes bacterium CA13]
MSKPTVSKPVTLRHFAFRIAGPREFCIAGAINGLIAYWLYGQAESVTLFTDYPLAAMLIPMSILLPGLSSFFGVLAASLGRKAAAIDPPMANELRWLPFAIRIGIGMALIVGLLTILILWGCRLQGFNPSFNGFHAFLAITVGSGLAAAICHVNAIFLSTRVL